LRALAKMIWLRRTSKPSFERKPCFSLASSSSVRSRTNIGFFVPQMIPYSYLLSCISNNYSIEQTGQIAKTPRPPLPERRRQGHSGHVHTPRSTQRATHPSPCKHHLPPCALLFHVLHDLRPSQRPRPGACPHRPIRMLLLQCSRGRDAPGMRAALRVLGIFQNDYCGKNAS